MRRLTHMLCVLAGTLPLVGCGGDEATRPDLAFVSTRDRDYAIFEMDAEGRGERRLTAAATDSAKEEVLFFQVDPAWSPGGTKIAFSSRRGGTFDIFVMNADGTGTRRLTSAKEDDSHPSWSPDGSQLAFARNGDVFVMDADGSNPRRISDLLVEEADPAWSPSGRWIAYTRRTPGTAAREVWRMRPDGSARQAVTAQGARVFTPAWSPDSMRIVFASNKDSEVFALFTIGVDGRGLRSVVPTVDDNFEPSWSPDGSRIAYSEDGAIFTVALGGRDVKKLTDNENNDSSPVWNPKPPLGE